MTPDPSRGLARGLRAAVLTVPAVGAAGVTHSAVDGCASWLGLAFAVGICWPAAVALLGTRRRLPTVLGWVLGAQLVTHVLLERMCSEVVSGQLTLSQHLLASLTPGMVLAHLTCAALTAVVLTRADATLWATRVLHRALARLLRRLALRPTRAPVAWAAPLNLPAPRVHVPELWRAPRPVRRGPPAFALR